MVFMCFHFYLRVACKKWPKNDCAPPKNHSLVATFFRKLNETKITTPLGLEKSLKLEANSGNVDICGKGNATLSYTKDL